MQSREIILIIFLAIWIVALFISGMLAIAYSKKHKNFNSVFKPFKELFEKEKKEFKTMTPIKIKYEMKDSEEAYLWEKGVLIFEEKPKSKTTKEIVKNHDEEDSDFWNEDILFLKRNFTLKKNKFKNPKYKGDLYITNNRVLIDDSNVFMQWPIIDIRRAWLSTFYMDKVHYPGFFLQTKKNTYEVICSNPKAIIYLNELIKSNLKEGENDENN